MHDPTDKEVTKILDMLEEHSPNWVDIIRRDRAAKQKRISSLIGDVKRLEREMKDADKIRAVERGEMTADQAFG